MEALSTAFAMDDAGPGGRLHGVLRLDDIHIALPISHIREVVPRPDKLCSMPATVPELLGSIDLRGTLVPVIDLGRMLRGRDHDAELSTAPIIMVLRVPGGVVGVPVQEVCGVLDLSPSVSTSLTCHSTTPVSALTCGGFSMDGCQGVILNANALTAMPGVILAEDRLVAEGGAISNGCPTLVFAAGVHRFGLAAEIIEATVPRRTVHDSPIDDPLWIGKIEHNGGLVPLVDTLHLLGLGSWTRTRETPSIVVRMGENARVALQIDGVLDMARIRPEQSLPFSDFSLDPAGLIAGLSHAEHTIFMLAPERVRTHPALADLAGLGESGPTDAEPPSRAADKALGMAGERQPYLIFSLNDDHHAVPLEQVSEILDADALQLVDLSAATTPIGGMIAHRGVAIPVVDLASRLAIKPGGNPRFILMTEDRGRFAGFKLEHLRAVERHRASDLGHVGTGRNGESINRSVIVTNEGITCMVLDMRQYMPFEDASRQLQET